MYEDYGSWQYTLCQWTAKIEPCSSTVGVFSQVLGSEVCDPGSFWSEPQLQLQLHVVIDSTLIGP
jgi:hypothetical protein